MRIIAKSRLRKYWETPGNEQSEVYLNEWYHFCLKQCWQTPQDVKDTFRNASFIANNRVVFNVKGNTYRIICSMDYRRQAMFIKFVGTHSEYDKVIAPEVN
ncbi:MAG: type II toxin-antitoxin system HigB family toxin [Legionellales bacterium]|nr:type II toxin-antitoxin system HigB family toxin [Legionellales bacterium]